MAGGQLDYTWTMHPSWYRPEGPRWSEYTFGPNNRVRSLVVADGSDVLDYAGRNSVALHTQGLGVEVAQHEFELEVRV